MTKRKLTEQLNKMRYLMEFNVSKSMDDNANQFQMLMEAEEEENKKKPKKVRKKLSRAERLEIAKEKAYVIFEKQFTNIKGEHTQIDPRSSSNLKEIINISFNIGGGKYGFWVVNALMDQYRAQTEHKTITESVIDNSYSNIITKEAQEIFDDIITFLFKEQNKPKLPVDQETLTFEKARKYTAELKKMAGFFDNPDVQSNFRNNTMEEFYGEEFSGMKNYKWYPLTERIKGSPNFKEEDYNQERINPKTGKKERGRWGLFSKRLRPIDFTWKEAHDLEQKFHNWVENNPSTNLEGKEVDGVHFMHFKEGWHWTFINSNYSGYDAGYLNHCGTVGRNSGDSIFSLRDKNEVPYVTVGYNSKTEVYVQAKGRKNGKPAKKYYPYLISLLGNATKPINGYKAEYSGSDFTVEDLDQDQTRHLIFLNPRWFRYLPMNEQEIKDIKDYLKEHFHDLGLKLHAPGSESGLQQFIIAHRGNRTEFKPNMKEVNIYFNQRPLNAKAKSNKTMFVDNEISAQEFILYHLIKDGIVHSDLLTTSQFAFGGFGFGGKKKEEPKVEKPDEENDDKETNESFKFSDLFSDLLK